MLVLVEISKQLTDFIDWKEGKTRQFFSCTFCFQVNNSLFLNFCFFHFFSARSLLFGFQLSCFFCLSFLTTSNSFWIRLTFFVNNSLADWMCVNLLNVRNFKVAGYFPKNCDLLKTYWINTHQLASLILCCFNKRCFRRSLTRFGQRTCMRLTALSDFIV